MIQAALVLQQKHRGSSNSKTKTVSQTWWCSCACNITDVLRCTITKKLNKKKLLWKKSTLNLTNCFSFILTILASLLHMSFLCEMCSLRSESNIYCIYNLWNWKICTLIWSSCQSTEQLLITTLFYQVVIEYLRNKVAKWVNCHESRKETCFWGWAVFVSDQGVCFNKVLYSSQQCVKMAWNFNLKCSARLW